MSNVYAPQEELPDGHYVYGADALGTFLARRPRYEDLDFGPVLGRFVTSGTENTIGFGDKQFILDIEDGAISLNDTVQIKPQNESVSGRWMAGLVTAKDLTVEPSQVTISVTDISEVGEGETYGDWLISRIAKQDLGLPASAAIGFSSTTFTIPAEGDLVAFDASPGKIYRANSVVLIKPTAGEEFELYFVALVRRYDEITGAIEVMNVYLGPDAEGEFDEWTITAVDLNVEDVDMFATSDTEVTIEPNVSKVFAVQTGKAFPIGGTVLIRDIVSTNKAIWRIESYVGTALTVRLALAISAETGTADAWLISLLDGPPELPSVIDCGYITDEVPGGAGEWGFVFDLADVSEDYGLITDPDDESEDWGAL